MSCSAFAKAPSNIYEQVTSHYGQILKIYHELRDLNYVPFVPLNARVKNKVTFDEFDAHRQKLIDCIEDHITNKKLKLFLKPLYPLRKIRHFFTISKYLYPEKLASKDVFYSKRLGRDVNLQNLNEFVYKYLPDANAYLSKAYQESKSSKEKKDLERVFDDMYEIILVLRHYSEYKGEKPPVTIWLHASIKSYYRNY